jgi:hypothetical protein
LLYILQVFIQHAVSIRFDHYHGFVVGIDVSIEFFSATWLDNGVRVGLVEEYIGSDTQSVTEDMIDQ